MKVLFRIKDKGKKGRWLYGCMGDNGMFFMLSDYNNPDSFMVNIPNDIKTFNMCVGTIPDNQGNLVFVGDFFESEGGKAVICSDNSNSCNMVKSLIFPDDKDSLNYDGDGGFLEPYRVPQTKISLDHYNFNVIGNATDHPELLSGAKFWEGR